MLRLRRRFGQALIVPGYAALSILLFLTVLSVLTASVGFNGLGVVNDHRYRSFETISDLIVLDGILHSRQTHHSSLEGVYTRPTLPPTQAGKLAYELFASGNTDGEFVSYKSHFGLHGLIFQVLYNRLHLSIAGIVLVNSLLTVLVLSAVYLALVYEFGALPAAAAALTFALSPYVVMYAKSLERVPWTLFLPVLLALLFGRQLFASLARAMTVGVVLFCGFLFRFLCGYEYITTIVLCATAPIIYYGLKETKPASVIASRILVVGLAVGLAFACAISLQASRVASDFSTGLRYVWMSAQKRTTLVSSDVQGVAEFACANDLLREKNCKEATIASLNSNFFGVVLVYLSFRDLLPWVNGPEFDLDRIVASDVKKAVVQGHFRELSAVLKRLDRWEMFSLLVMSVQCLCGLGLLTAVTVAALIDRRQGWRFAALVFTSFVGAVSWLVLAKGWSMIHTHLGFIVWNIGFVPFSVLYLVWRKQRSRSDEMSSSARPSLLSMGGRPAETIFRHTTGVEADRSSRRSVSASPSNEPISKNRRVIS